MKANPAFVKTETTTIVSSIEDERLREACFILIADERFWKAPAAAKKHQAWEGGLAEHTLENLQIALATCEAPTLKNFVNRDVVIAALLWHDYGKIWDYQKNPMYEKQPLDLYQDPNQPEYVYTRHRWTSRHLVRSYHEFFKAAETTGVSLDLTEQVNHAILAHHGPNTDSPVPYYTIEAMIVHNSDEVSAVFTGKPHIFREPREAHEWKRIYYS